MFPRPYLARLSLILAVTLAGTGSVCWPALAQNNMALPSPQGVPNPTVTPNGNVGPAGNQFFAGPNTLPLQPSTPNVGVAGMFPTVPANVAGFGQPTVGGPGSALSPSLPPPSMSAPQPLLGPSGIGRGLPGMTGGPPLNEPMGAAAGGCPYC